MAHRAKSKAKKRASRKKQNPVKTAKWFIVYEREYKGIHTHPSTHPPTHKQTCTLWQEREGESGIASFFEFPPLFSA
jgi:hypothetical protein